MIFIVMLLVVLEYSFFEREGKDLFLAKLRSVDV